MKTQSLIKNINIKDTLLLFLLSILFLIPRVWNLGFDVINIDYPLWDNRSSNFYIYLKTFNFAETFRAPHPGVTLMWLAGGAIELFNRLYFRAFGGFPVINDVAIFPWRSLSIKLSIVFALLILVLVSVLLIERLFGKTVSLLFLALIAIEPYFVAHNRLFHLDSLLAMFMFNSLLGSLLFVRRGGYIYLVQAALSSSLAFLTKITGVFSIVFLIFVLQARYFLSSSKNERGLFKYFKALFFSIVLVVIFSILFFPASWVDPLGVIKKVVAGALAISSGGHSQYFWGKWTNNPGIFYYPVVLLFKMSPVLLGGIVLGIWIFLRKKIKFSREIRFILIYILSFLIFLSIPAKKVPRYIIPLFPPLILTVSYILANYVKNIFFLISLCFAFLMQIFLLYSVYPNFLAYNNPILGGMRSSSYFIGNKHFGFGLKEVAEYLNKKPHAKEIRLIFAGDGSIGPFFEGMTRNETYIYRDTFAKTDYFLIPYYEVDRNKIYLEFKRRLVLDKVFKVNGFDYWYLYKNKSKIKGEDERIN